MRRRIRIYGTPYAGCSIHRAAFFAAALLFAATGCTEDTDGGSGSPVTGERLSFTVTDSSGDWTMASRATQTTIPSEASEPLLLDDGGTAGDELYLQAVVTEDFASEGTAYNPELATRAAPVTQATFTGAFGCFAYPIPAGEAWTTSRTPDLMNNVRITGTDGSYAAPDTYRWPSGKKLRFYAYYPYGNTHVNFETWAMSSDYAYSGAPILTYSVPSDVAAQQDLMVASTEDLSAGGDVRLTFKHALTAIRFKAADGLTDCTVKSVAIKNVCKSGNYKMADGEWVAFSAGDFSLTLDKAVTVDSQTNRDNVVTTEAQTFMMIPQTLPDDAVIEAVVNNGSSKELTLTAKIKSMTPQWQPGQTITYLISRNDFKVDVQFYPDSYGYTSHHISADGEPYRLTFDFPAGVTYIDAKIVYQTIIDKNSQQETDGEETIDDFSSLTNPFTAGTAKVLTGRLPKFNETNYLYKARVAEQTKVAVLVNIASKWAFTIRWTDRDGNEQTSRFNPFTDDYNSVGTKWFTVWEGWMHAPHYYDGSVTKRCWSRYDIGGTIATQESNTAQAWGMSDYYEVDPDHPVYGKGRWEVATFGREARKKEIEPLFNALKGYHNSTEGKMYYQIGGSDVFGEAVDPSKVYVTGCASINRDGYFYAFPAGITSSTTWNWDVAPYETFCGQFLKVAWGTQNQRWRAWTTEDPYDTKFDLQ